MTRPSLTSYQRRDHSHLLQHLKRRIARLADGSTANRGGIPFAQSRSRGTLTAPAPSVVVEVEECPGEIVCPDDVEIWASPRVSLATRCPRAVSSARSASRTARQTGRATCVAAHAHYPLPCCRSASSASANDRSTLRATAEETGQRASSDVRRPPHGSPSGPRRGI